MLWIAGKLIRIAAFFGISRRQLIVVWVLLSSVIQMLPSKLCEVTTTGAALFLIGIVTIAFLYLSTARLCYREDNILADHIAMISPCFRLTAFAVLLLASIWSMFSFSPEWYKWTSLVLKVAIPLYFWPWFCLRQSPKDPVTLRGLVRDWITKARQALTPSPSPQPVPVPISNFRSL